MKLLEKLLYSVVLFLFVYVVLSMGMRLFQLSDNYTSHMVGGIAATILSVLLFMFLIVKKQTK